MHDHDTTYYSYGSDHQECLVHILRYIKDEPELKLNKEMNELSQEMIHYRNGLDTEEAPELIKVKEYEERYQKILDYDKDEYEYVPPSDYYREGYNLYKRLDKYKDNHLLFLHNKG